MFRGLASGLYIARENRSEHTAATLGSRASPDRGRNFAFRCHMRRRAGEKMSLGRILVVDDEPQIRAAWLAHYAVSRGI